MRYLIQGVAAAAVGLAIAAAPAAFADNSTPATPSPNLAKLQTMVDNLGYKTTLSSSGESFSFQWPGAKYDYQVDMDVSTNGATVYVYNYINTLSATDLTKVPYEKILEYQNSGNVFFSMENTAQGEDFYINQVFGLSGLTPEQLRDELTQFGGALDKNEALWNVKLWH